MRKQWGKIWDFLWNSDSIWSWIADLVILYVIVKLVFFPLMSLIFASPLPSVIVESGSMEHKISSDGLCGVYFNQKEKVDFNKYWQTCGSWYEDNGITESQFLEWPYPNGVDIGDIIIISGRWKNDLKEGDIIVFNANQRLPIIHRVIKIDEFISTKGDHNEEQLSVEKKISESQVIGKAVFRIPKAGWAKLIFVKLFSVFK